MNFRNIICALAVPFVFLATARASDRKDCDQELSTNGMYQCLVFNFGLADSALNATWSDLKAAYEGPSGQSVWDALVKAQLIWISLRDADCASEGKVFEDGSLEKVIIQGCLVRKTDERTAYLRGRLPGDEL